MLFLLLGYGNFRDDFVIPAFAGMTRPWNQQIVYAFKDGPVQGG